MTATLFDLPAAPVVERPARRTRATEPARIGTLLGPAEVGSHSSATEGRGLTPDQRSEFRQMAAHPDPVSAGERRSGADPVPRGRASRAATVLAVLVVAAVAAVASYEHMRALALLAGEGWRSWLLPLSVDGLVLAASMVLLDARRAGRRAGALPWLALVLGAGASLAANVAAADPTPVGRLVAAWPPVALLLAFELLLRQVDGSRS